MISRMEFDCKLAHNDEVKRITGFTSIKELYQKISQLFCVPTNEILYCTLNTHNFRYMNALLSNYLSLGDMIVVHMCGKSKELSITKTCEYLGLTITDNGNGRAFVKKIKSNEDVNEESIKLGDHIAALNNESTIGMRHFEVAKAIREVPQQTSFTLQLIEPLYLEKYMDGSLDRRREPEDNRPEADLNLNDRADISLLNFAEINYKNSQLQNHTSRPTTNLPTHQQVPESTGNLESLYDDLSNSSLPIDRLLSKSTSAQYRGNTSLDGSTTSQNQDSYRQKIDKINSILESFLGINDNALAIQIYRLAKENKDSFNKFLEAIDTSELNVFNFSEDIKTYLWDCALG